MSMLKSLVKTVEVNIVLSVMMHSKYNEFFKW